MTKNRLGHVAEIFCGVSMVPDASRLSEFKRLGHPVILDSYGLFDRKIEGDWRIVAHQSGYLPPEHDDTFFTSGIGLSCKRVDIFDNEVPISPEQARSFRDYSPMGDQEIKEELGLH